MTALIGMIGWVAVNGSVGAEAPVRVYVSPEGDDAWSGRLTEPSAAGDDGPLATVGRAKDAIRQARRQEGEGRYTVVLRGGTYRLDEPLVLEPQDGGGPDGRVTYEAYGDERPVLSGGTRIEGWRRVEDGLWAADVPQGWEFHQLFVNGQRRPRARQPNDGYLGTAGPLPEIGNPHTDREKPESRLGFTYREGDLQRWDDLEDVNLYLYHDWGVSMHWVAELAEARQTVRFTAPCNWPVGQWERSGQRYHLENSRAFLDAPGEWHLDREERRVYYRPMKGEDVARAEIVAPRLHRLLELRGDPDAEPIENVTFRGIAFQYAAWDRPRDEPTDGQAAHFLSAAIVAFAAQGCAFERCDVAHVGEYALWLHRGCRGNRIRQCHIHDMGGGGVRIGEPGYYEELRWLTERNTVDNCFIHDGGNAFPAGVGVWIGHSGHNRVIHNEIRDLYYSGVSAGWAWGYGPSRATHNIIERNHIHRLGFGVLSELGAVYTLGRSEGTRIRHNLLHDTWDYRYGSWGIALDEGSAHMLVEGNVVCNHAHGLGLHYGTENDIRRNVIDNCRADGLGIGRKEEHLQLRFHQNVVVARQGSLITDGWAGGTIESEDNLYWHADLGDWADLAGMPLAEWRERGHDRRSAIADPLFVDPEGLDFGLREGSPAEGLGLPHVTARNTGLYGDPDWVGLPSRTPERPNAAAGSSGRAVNEFAFDFEEERVGENPQLAAVSGEDEEASIRITDGVAAEGRQSLKITDAGHEPNFQPHMYYQPQIGRGHVRVAFDVRLGEGAILVHQWRDWPAGPAFESGPTLFLSAGGQIIANERPVGIAPVEEWIHVAIACGIGRDNHGTYTLRLTTGDGEVVVDDLPAGSERFRRLNWIGFISDATEASVVYLDNVELARE